MEANLQRSYSETLRISSQGIDMGEERIKEETFSEEQNFQNCFDRIMSYVKSKELTLIYSWRTKTVGAVI